MALSKKITDAKGVQTNYHKIVNVEVVKRNRYVRNEDKTVTIVPEYQLNSIVASYVSQDIRNSSEANSAAVRNFSFTVDSDTMASKTLFELVYDKLKETDYFAGAEDC